MKYLLIVILTIISLGLFGQKNEISLSNSGVYLDNQISYGVGFHYLRDKRCDRWLQGPYKIGIGIESIPNQHNTFGLILEYNLTDKLFFDISPNIIFSENTYSYGFHFESGYEFEVGRFCLSPVAHLSIDPEDYHLGLGLHLGFNF